MQNPKVIRILVLSVLDLYLYIFTFNDELKFGMVENPIILQRVIIYYLFSYIGLQLHIDKHTRGSTWWVLKVGSYLTQSNHPLRCRFDRIIGMRMNEDNLGAGKADE